MPAMCIHILSAMKNYERHTNVHPRNNLQLNWKEQANRHEMASECHKGVQPLHVRVLSFIALHSASLPPALNSLKVQEEQIAPQATMLSMLQSLCYL